MPFTAQELAEMAAADKVAAQQKAYREANREKWSAYQRAYRAKKKREAETP